MASTGFLDKLEEGIVFRVSRFFFLTLIVLAMLTIIGGTAYVVWGLTSTTQPTPPGPLKITAADVRPHLNDVDSVSASATAGSTSPGASTQDPNESHFNALVDTLRILMPIDQYSWEPQGHNVGEGWNQTWVTTEKGVGQHIKDLLEPLSGYDETIPALQNLTVVLKGFPDKDRLRPLKAFVKVYLEKREAHKIAEQSAAEKYTTSQEEKMSARTIGLAVVVGAISLMAFVAMYLVLLSVQRNVKKLAAREQAAQ